MNEPLTLRQALAEARADLAMYSSAGLDAELLLCEVMQCDRSRLYSAACETLEEKLMDRFRALVNRRKSGMPVAYLTGIREFWSLPLKVDVNTLVPRPETECLVEQALSLVPEDATINIADLGTGSGAIAIAIAAERPGCQITATDISAPALAVAEKNARRHKIRNIRFLNGNWLDILDDKYELIVSNPPYIRSDDTHLQSVEIANEPLLALDGGPDGLTAIREIIRSAPACLQPGGWLVIEHGYDQAADVQCLLQQDAFTGIRTIRDYAGIERLTSARYRPDNLTMLVDQGNSPHAR